MQDSVNVTKETAMEEVGGEGGYRTFGSYNYHILLIEQPPSVYQIKLSLLVQYLMVAITIISTHTPLSCGRDVHPSQHTVGFSNTSQTTR